MPPSLSMILRLGCFCRTPEKTRSIDDHIRLVANEAMALMNGMSGAGAEGPARACAEKENPGTKLPDPKCRASGVSVSSRAFHIGSQWSDAKDGRPSGTGLSGKDTVRAPIAAVRRISSDQLRVPRRQDCQRDVPLGGGGAPFLDGEVVPRLHAGQGEVLVLGPLEHASAETGEGREAQRGLDTVDLHVSDTRHRVVAAR